MAISSASRHYAGAHVRGMHAALWIVQALLGAGFGLGGLMKATLPIDELTDVFGWPADLPLGLVRFIGVSELLGGIGLVLPSLTRIRPLLTPLAALGIMTIMLFAMVFHISRQEWQTLPVNLVFGALAAFVAWGRYRLVPIPPRTA